MICENQYFSKTNTFLLKIWSFGVVLWELLTCEIPYKELDSSAIIWGIGNETLQVCLICLNLKFSHIKLLLFFQLPIPSKAPEVSI